MNYKKFTGIILKKQNYREADQIVSIWTREAGKIRVLAKALRKPASKLNYALGEFSEAEIQASGSHLPTLIAVQPLRQFSGLKEDLKKAAAAFYAAELMLKMTADEHPNVAAYDLLLGFLNRLEREEVTDHSMVDEFALNLAAALGFGGPAKNRSHRDVNQFIEYILERNVKSESFLISI